MRADRARLALGAAPARRPGRRRWRPSVLRTSPVASRAAWCPRRRSMAGPCSSTGFHRTRRPSTGCAGRGLTGAKEGCAEGECGACAVLVARPPTAPGGTEWTAVNACLVPAAALDGQEVVTAEGLGSPDDLHPVQHELAVRGGSQCGYCTPGFVCSMAAEFYRAGREPAPRLDGRRHTSTTTAPTASTCTRSSGNLCRCTGYRPIRDAAYALGAPRADDPLAARRRRAAPRRPHDPARRRRRRVRAADRPRRGPAAAAARTPTPCSSPARTDWGVDVNLRGARAPLRHRHRPRSPELRDAPRGPTSRRDRRGPHPHRDRAAPRRPRPAARRALPAVRLAADPQRRHHRRQPRHRLADRRRRAGAARARGRRRARVRRRRAGGARSRSTSPATAQTRPASRRADPRGADPAAAQRRSPPSTRSPSGGSTTSPAWPSAFALDVARRRRDPGAHRARRRRRDADPGPGHRGRARGAAVDGETVADGGDVLARRGHADRRPPGQRRLPRGDARHRAAAGCTPRRASTASRRCRHERASPTARRTPSSAQPIPHESAALHVTGAALYTDDLVRRTPRRAARPPRAGAARPRPRDPARIAAGLRRAGRRAGARPPHDVPGRQRRRRQARRAALPDEVMFHGHAVCWVLGETLEAARLGAAGRRGRLRAAARDRHGARGDRGRELPGRAAARCERGDVERRPRARGPRLQRRDSSSPGRSTSTSRRTARSRSSTRTARSSCSRSTQHPTRDPGDRRPRARPAEPRGHRAVPADGRRLRRQGDAAARARRGRRARRHPHRPPGAAAARPAPRT